MANIGLLHTLLVRNEVSRTRSRDDVFATMHRLGPCRVVEIVRVLEGRVSRATVYDTVDLFVKIGVAAWVREDLVELQHPFRQHHHHFVCTKCGKWVDFNDDQLESKLERMAKQRNMTLTGHLVELSGLCSMCA